MFDIYNDNGALLQAVYPSKSDMPDWVKQCGLPGPDELSKLASDEAALMLPVGNHVRPVWPIVDAGTTHISCLYFENTYQNLPSEDMQKRAAVALYEACERFGLEPTQKVAELASDYHDISPIANHRDIPFPDQGIRGSSMFPLSTPDQVKMASMNFLSVVKKLAPEERREFAVNLSKQASYHDMDVPNAVDSWGGTHVDQFSLIEAIEQRVQRIEDPVLAEALRKSAEEISFLPPEEAALCLSTIDKEAGLDVLWDREIRDPYSIFGTPTTEDYRNVTIKVAEFDIDRESWRAACDQYGILDGFDDEVRRTLRDHPEVLEEHRGTPIEDYVADRLRDIGLA